MTLDLHVRTLSRGEKIAQVIIHHVEKIYGPPITPEEYNIVITDGTAGNGELIKAFMKDKAFVEINAIEENPDLFYELTQINELGPDEYKIENARYVDVMYIYAQDVVVLTPYLIGSYQMMTNQELTVSGYTLNNIISMIFMHNRLTSVIVFILPIRYNTKLLEKHKPTYYEIDGELICVISHS